MPEISVIIPTLNEEGYLGLTLRSLAMQNFRDFEVIVIDGGSKDRTLEIAKKYKARILLIPNANKKGGVAYQQNRGAKLAKGKILAFTGADIILPPQWLQRISEEFNQNKNLLALAGSDIPFDAPLIGKIEYGIYNVVRTFFARLPKRCRRFSCSSGNLAVRKKYFEKVGGFDIVPINIDGIFGRKLHLLYIGELKFDLSLYVFISARRMKRLGFIKFNKYFFYVIENVILSLHKTRFIKSIKLASARSFRDRELFNKKR